jgi:hypothetical protein
MKNKPQVEMKSYRATVTLQYEAPSKELAPKRAKEAFGDTPGVKIKIQDGYLAWTTVKVPGAPTQG